jgi:hypothetical protein
MILEKHSTCSEIVPNPVGGGEIAAAAGGVPFFDQAVDRLDRYRQLIVFSAAQTEDAEDAIDFVECLANHWYVARRHLVGIDRGVQRSHELKYRAERSRRIEVVTHRRCERRARFLDTRRYLLMRSCLCHAIEAGEKIGQPSQRLFSLTQARPCEIQLFAIVC